MTMVGMPTARAIIESSPNLGAAEEDVEFEVMDTGGGDIVLPVLVEVGATRGVV
jgi:hypothetical protein